jgi:hypothetical protein
VAENSNVVSDSTVALSGKPILERPFYFIMVVWGDQFVDYFVEYCLPTLMSAGNIPALSTRRPSKFLIATYPEDWERMQAAPIFQRLARHVEPVFIEIPRCPPERSGCEHMGIGHKRACEIAYRDKAYAMVLTPDCMLSDGSVARLQQLAFEGVALVLASALRFGEEPFLGRLRETGAIPADDQQGPGTPLTISGRQMVAAAVHGLHSETLRYEWGSPYFALLPAAVWWAVRGEEGMLVHCLSWAPLMLDYAAVRQHDTSTLENWTIDGDYVFKNLESSASVYVVQDSDEMFLASWGPMADREQTLTPNFIYRLGKIGHFVKRLTLLSSFNGGIFDPLKQKIFFLPVRWHSRPLNEAWKSVEYDSLRTLRFLSRTLNYTQDFNIITKQGHLTAPIFDSAISGSLENALSGDYGGGVRAFVRLSAEGLAILSRLAFVLSVVWQKRGRNIYRISMILRGDPNAWRWSLWRLRGLGAELRGRHVSLPMPCPPPEAGKNN